MMAFIDNKGRIFGKINIIDLTFIILVIVALVFGARFIFLKPETEWVTVEVISREQPLNVINNLQIGKELINNQGEKVGEITDIDVVKSDSKDDNVIILALSLQAQKKNNRWYYNRNYLTVNSNLNLNFGDIFINKALVTSVGEKKHSESVKTVRVLFRNMDTWLEEVIEEGDTEKDYNRRVIAKVIKKTEEPSKMIVVTDAGEVYAKENPLKKDVTLTFEIIAQERGDYSLFQNEMIKIGRDFRFENQDYFIEGKITDIV
mgnify:CR=1 FL=1